MENRLINISLQPVPVASRSDGGFESHREHVYIYRLRIEAYVSNVFFFLSPVNIASSVEPGHNDMG
jgi:hypothetical protein